MKTTGLGLRVDRSSQNRVHCLAPGEQDQDLQSLGEEEDGDREGKGKKRKDE